MQYSEEEKRLFTHAQELSRANDLEGTLLVLEQLVKLRPDSAMFNATYANTLGEAGDVDAAERHFRVAVSLAPKKEMYSLGLFHCLWDQEKHEDALDEIHRFVAAGGDSADYREIVQEIKEKWADDPIVERIKSTF